jgi:hypothetical protein
MPIIRRLREMATKASASPNLCGASCPASGLGESIESNRLVYRIKGDDVELIACRYHYSDR